MLLDRFTTQLVENEHRINAMASGVTDFQAHWKPDDVVWSIVEVINHLYDEERLDFRVRIDYTLHKPNKDWPDIDPEGWVIEREYNKRGLSVSLANFRAERQASLAWLESLSTPDWDISYQAPFGLIKAGNLLAAWVAHDLLHLRQLIDLQWVYMLKQVRPYDVRYAGEW